MLVNYYAGTLVTNPILLNTWLMDNDSGYRNSGDFSDVSIARYAREEHGLSLHYCGRTISLDSVRETICRQDAAILKVPDHPQHFVLATAISGLGPNTTITVADPGRGSGFLRDVTSYLNARLYSSAACYQSGIRLLGKSPIALLVEDPLGRRAGVDPSTGQQIQEIPGGFFELWSLGADDDSGEAEPPVLEFEVLTTLDGIYTVAVSGTDIGAYHLTFLGYDANGEETAFTVFGVTAPQHTDEYQFAFAPGLQSSITEPRHAASLLGLTFEVSVCRTLGLIDNDGLARSLAQKLRAVSAALQRGSPSAARNALRAFIQEVSAQSGKHLTTEAAGLLRGDAESLLK